jgi:hypothetical protein
MSFKNQKGDWDEPINLGSTINTEYDEEGPVLDLDGKTLYFSSIGHKGMGGFDIFKTVYDAQTKTWSEPVNLGYPINSADDDIYFTLSGDGRHGYYASVKEGGFGEKDLYRIVMPPRTDYDQLVSKVKEIVKLSQLHSDKDLSLAETDPKLKSSFENITEEDTNARNVARMKMEKLKSDSLQAAKDADEKLKLKNVSSEERAKLEKLKASYIQLSKDVDDRLKANEKDLTDDEKARLGRIKSDAMSMVKEIDDILSATKHGNYADARMRFDKLRSDFDVEVKVSDERLIAKEKILDDEKIRLRKLKSDSLELAQG